MNVYKNNFFGKNSAIIIYIFIKTLYYTLFNNICLFKNILHNFETRKINEI